MNHAAELRKILSSDSQRWRVLATVRSLALPDCWIGAGFVRNAVWDRLHGRPPGGLSGDVDVLWFCPDRAHASADERLQAELSELQPRIAWSVKNQARMHLRNDDAPYASTADAMRYWPETATAIAARLTRRGECEIAAPFGLDDLFGLVLRPTPRFAGGKHQTYVDRVRTKGWLTAWPLLRSA